METYFKMALSLSEIENLATDLEDSVMQAAAGRNAPLEKVLIRARDVRAAWCRVPHIDARKGLDAKMSSSQVRTQADRSESEQAVLVAAAHEEAEIKFTADSDEQQKSSSLP